MRRWIAQTGSSYVALVAGIEVGGSFDEAPTVRSSLAGFIDGANRSRRQIAMTAPVTQQKAGWEHPEARSPPLGDAAGPGGGAVGFDFGDPQLEHGYNPDRACRIPS